ncbi:MAG: alginate lyase family protein, partial [Pseudomonadota bacterium]
MCHARKDASLAWTSGHDISCGLASCRVLLLAVVGIFASPASSFACATPPQPIIDLDLGRYYTDAAGTRVDPSRLATHRAATADLKAYIRGITRSADAAWQARTASARADAARCGTAWLIAWAEAGAYLGRMKSKQAEYQRKWDLAGAALAYLKLRHAVSSRDHATIGAWLSAIADNAERFQLAPGRKPNNHLHWLALGSAATAIATDNAQRWR